MIKHYHTIIWGASGKAVQQAADLLKSGTKVLLLNKLGFPGGDITEGLECFLENEFFVTSLGMKIKSDAETYPKGVFMQIGKGLLLHPESVKKSMWEFLFQSGADYLFHVVPLSVEKQNGYFKLNVYGKEGKMAFYCDNWYDFSDEKYLLRAMDSEAIKPKSAGLQLFYNRIPDQCARFIPWPLKQTDSEEFTWLQVNLDMKTGDIGSAFNRVLGFIIKTLYQELNVKPLIIPYRPIYRF